MIWELSRVSFSGRFRSEVGRGSPVAFRCLERRSSKPIASWGSDGVVDVLVGLEVFDEALAVGDLYAVEASYSSDCLNRSCLWSRTLLTCLHGCRPPVGSDGLSASSVAASCGYQEGGKISASTPRIVATSTVASDAFTSSSVNRPGHRTWMPRMVKVRPIGQSASTKHNAPVTGTSACSTAARTRSTWRRAPSTSFVQSGRPRTDVRRVATGCRPRTAGSGGPCNVSRR